MDRGIVTLHSSKILFFFAVPLPLSKMADVAEIHTMIKEMKDMMTGLKNGLDRLEARGTENFPRTGIDSTITRARQQCYPLRDAL